MYSVVPKKILGFVGGGADTCGSSGPTPQRRIDDACTCRLGDHYSGVASALLQDYNQVSLKHACIVLVCLNCFAFDLQTALSAFFC